MARTVATTVLSEKCMARWGSEYDEIRVIMASFVRVLQSPVLEHYSTIEVVESDLFWFSG